MACLSAPVPWPWMMSAASSPLRRPWSRNCSTSPAPRPRACRARRSGSSWPPPAAGAAAAALLQRRCALLGAPGTSPAAASCVREPDSSVDGHAHLQRAPPPPAPRRPSARGSPRPCPAPSGAPTPPTLRASAGCRRLHLAQLRLLPPPRAPRRLVGPLLQRRHGLRAAPSRLLSARFSSMPQLHLRAVACSLAAARPR